MSTEIHEIEGTFHSNYYPNFTTTRDRATIHLNRFYNGKELGSQLQLTISQDKGGGTSYIHLSKEQCEELASALLIAFDREIIPSE